MIYHLQIPVSDKELAKLEAGDTIYLSGVIYSARDAAHKRMYENLEKNLPLPIAVDQIFLYYMGPSPARENKVIGSAGPTTSSRMDKYTPALLDLGVRGMIGKGKRSLDVKEAMKRNNAVYMAAVGGAGALLSKAIISSEVVAYEDLGAEAIRKLEVKDFPVIVVIDCKGNDLYEQAIAEYNKE